MISGGTREPGEGAGGAQPLEQNVWTNFLLYVWSNKKFGIYTQYTYKIRICLECFRKHLSII